MSYGCSSHMCEIEKPTGQGTNGGCMCFNSKKALMVHRQLKRQVEELQSDMSKAMVLIQICKPDEANLVLYEALEKVGEEENK